MEEGRSVDKRKLYLEKYQAWKEKRGSYQSQHRGFKMSQIKLMETTRSGDVMPFNNHNINNNQQSGNKTESEPYISSKGNSLKNTNEMKRLGLTTKSSVRRTLGCVENSLPDQQNTNVKKECALVKPKGRRSSLRLSKQSVQLQKPAASKLPVAKHSSLKLNRPGLNKSQGLVNQQCASTRPHRPLTTCTSSMFAIRQTKTSLARLFPNHKEEILHNQQKWHTKIKKTEQNSRCGIVSNQRIQLQKRAEPTKNTKSNINRRRTMPIADKRIGREKRYSVAQSFKKTNLSVRAELEKWLISKGRTPSRCRHMSCFGHGVGETSTDLSRSTTKRMLSVAELSSQQKALELERVNEDKLGEKMSRKLGPMLKECFDLLDLGCPSELLLCWLNDVEVNLPLSGTSSEFWLCRARVMLSTGNTDKVLEIMEKAVQVGAKPSDVLAKGLTSLVKKMTESSYSYEGKDVDNPENVLEAPSIYVQRDPRVLAPLSVNIALESSAAKTPALERENVFRSSAIKLCVKANTPFLKRMADQEMGGPCVVITPVRRSTRRSLATIPGFLHDKDRLYSSVMEMPEDEQHSSLYRENPAIPSDSFLQLQT